MECRGDFKSATQRMTQIAGFLHRYRGAIAGSSTNCFLADAQLACGDWMTKYKTQPANVVLKDYLKPGKELATDILEIEQTRANTNRAVSGSRQLGTVYALLYEDLRLRVESKQWKEDGERLKLMEGELKNIEQDKKSLLKARMSKELRSEKANILASYANRLSSQIEEKRKERQEIELSIPVYLKGSIKSLLLAMKLADSGSDVDLSSTVYRVISLWFSASDNVQNGVLLNINTYMMEAMEQMLSFRFVPLTKQIFSRIDSDSVTTGNGFQKALHRLVFKMCDDHPYHCLLPLLTLENGSIGINRVPKNAKDSSMTAMEQISKSKTDSAQEMMNQLKKCALPYVSQLVESYRLLTEAYNVLAYASTADFEKNKSSNQKKQIKFSALLSPAHPKLDRCLENLPILPTVLTSVPELRPGRDYGNGTDDPAGAERIKSFERTFDMAPSGVSRPKIIMCIGARGGRYKQLVKGNDDVRQDSIMSQVFLYVNELMDRREDEANERRFSERRRLKLLRYEVVPLSPNSGVSVFLKYLSPRFYIGFHVHVRPLISTTLLAGY
jgi:serine-protein kinase ATM